MIIHSTTYNWVVFHKNFIIIFKPRSIPWHGYNPFRFPYCAWTKHIDVQTSYLTLPFLRWSPFCAKSQLEVCSSIYAVDVLLKCLFLSETEWQRSFCLRGMDQSFIISLKPSSLPSSFFRHHSRPPLTASSSDYKGPGEWSERKRKSAGWE